MRLPAPTPHIESIDSEFTLRTLAGADDVERLALFNAKVHGAELAATTRDLLLRHPALEPLDQVFVENGAGEIVSCLCFIPWTWRMGRARIPVGEMGIVGTDAAYRGRGLIRAQVRYFMRRLRERGCLLSCIQGIPYFYRQFGYDYALPLEAGWRLELRQIPHPPESALGFRLATIDDIGALQSLYESSVEPLGVRAERSDGVWRYLLRERERDDAMATETWVVTNADGAVCGYLRIPWHHFGDELTINEASSLHFDAAWAALHHAKTLAEARNRPGLRLNMPEGSNLVTLARGLGARDAGTYAWQIHVPDAVGLLRAMAPTLEARLKCSMFAGLSHDVSISFYRGGALLRFLNGKLVSVSKSSGKNADLRLPPQASTPLLLGHKSWQELREIYADVSTTPLWRPLFDVLFPVVDGFLYSNY